MTAPVSVIIPAYNAAAFIEDALKSVVQQSAPVSEIVVIDDGSSDDTASIAELYATVVRGPHSGVSAARNVGIRMVTQPWVAFLDADDLWSPSKIEKQLQAGVNNTTGVVETDHCRFSTQDGNMPHTLVKSRAYQSISSEAIGPSMVLLDEETLASAYVQYGNLLQPSTLLVRRDLLLSVGCFDESFRYSEHHDLLLRLLKHARFAVVEELLVRMRVHDNNVSKNWVEILSGSAEAIRKITVAPEEYPPHIALLARREHARTLRELGRELCRQGQYRAARDVLIEAARSKPSFADQASTALTFVMENPVAVRIRGQARCIYHQLKKTLRRAS